MLKISNRPSFSKNGGTKIHNKTQLKPSKHQLPQLINFGSDVINSDPKALYGATAGVAFVNGIAAERFAVRYSDFDGMTWGNLCHSGGPEKYGEKKRRILGDTYLEPQTTIYKWLFQWDDSKSLYRKWLFHRVKNAVVSGEMSLQAGGWRTILLRY